ncbi:MAG: cytochrome c family protein [Chloracidobacterium sp.]|nr:cytochrome c family protein [Chloracidobacterium sp.]MDW8218318.1 cytochrome c3 family protein [Acidobacteriota bacterium]
MKQWLIAAYILGAGWLLLPSLLTARSTVAATPFASAALTPVEDASTKMPGKMVFDNTESDPPFSKYAGYRDDKGKAPFDHQQHVDYKGSTCVVCHHTNSKTLAVKEDGAASEPVMKCTVCHTDENMKPSPVEGTNEDHKFKGVPAIEAMEAYHGVDNSKNPASEAGCITCHKRLAKEFPKAGQVISCNSCHTGKDS